MWRLGLPDIHEQGEGEALAHTLYTVLVHVHVLVHTCTCIHTVHEQYMCTYICTVHVYVFPHSLSLPPFLSLSPSPFPSLFPSLPRTLPPSLPPVIEASAQGFDPSEFPLLSLGGRVRHDSVGMLGSTGLPSRPQFGEGAPTSL